jgi:hypothetical protein
MRTPNSLYTEAGTMSASFKAAVLVVVLSVVLVAADRTMLRPHDALQMTDRATPTAFAAVDRSVFALPPELRPNEGDVPPPVATF